MRIIRFIEDKSVVEKILRHLGLWQTRNHGPRALSRRFPFSPRGKITEAGINIIPADAFHVKDTVK